MKLLYLLFFLTISQTLFSQEKLDSLFSVWEDKTQADTTRLNSLLELLNQQYFIENPDSSISLASLGIEYAEQKNIPKIKAHLINQRGMAYAFKGDNDKALSHYKKSRDIYDSLKITLSKANATANIGNIYFAFGNLDEALTQYEESAKIYKKLNKIENLAGLYINMGIIAKSKGSYDKAIDYYLKSIEAFEELGNEKSKLIALVNLGTTYFHIGNLIKANEVFNETLELSLKLNSKKGTSISYTNLANIYKNRGNLKKAIEYYTKSISINEEIKDYTSQTSTLLNLGNLYLALNEKDKALTYYLKSLEISKKQKNLENMASAYELIATYYAETKDYNNAIENNRKALDLRKKAGLKEGISQSLTNLASNYISLAELKSNEKQEVNIESKYNNRIWLLNEASKMLNESRQISLEIENEKNIATIFSELARIEKINNNYKKAISYSLKAFQLAKKAENLELQIKVTEMLKDLYNESGNYKKALAFHEKFISLRDSLNSIENEKALIQQEYKSQYERQAEADSIKHAQAQKVKQIEIERQKAEIKQKKIQQYALFGGIGLMLLFALYILRKNKRIKEQKLEIEKQKHFAEQQQRYAEQQREELHEQHKQIKDSINYAQTLQKAVLPSFEDVNLNFPQNFVFFQPKDVVSGDFFWTYAKEGLRFLAVIDCTGHGVPGAFMTIVANNILNEIVQENFWTPIDIVTELHKRIKIRIGGHKDAKVRDSMDLALLRYDSSHQEVLFVGTHMSLYLVRNGELHKYKGSKADIGYSDELKLKQHAIKVQRNDMLYMHTDGYPDQKGGAKNKKFYYQPIRTKMQEIYLFNLDEQMLIFKETFNTWKGDREQLDDVTVVGVRI